MILHKTKAIVLNRRNYGEADRIISVLTPDNGKLSLIAKGARSMKSKLAGAIELFTINDIGYIEGRGELCTLTYGRLERNFPDIVKDIDRVQLGYEVLKNVDKSTDTVVESDYYSLLGEAFAGLDDPSIDSCLIKLWYLARLIAISGHTPNLVKDANGTVLSENKRYGFDPAAMNFFVQNGVGIYRPIHIKFLRIVFVCTKPGPLKRINGAAGLADDLQPLINQIYNYHLNS
jgi:DNA repair protein RecO